MALLTDDDLEFTQIRTGTDQWEVRCSSSVVARVTHRVVASPQYLITRVVDGEDNEEVKRETRDEVCDVILAWVNSNEPLVDREHPLHTQG